jgi:metal transporter CNNM
MLTDLNNVQNITNNQTILCVDSSSSFNWKQFFEFPHVSQWWLYLIYCTCSVILVLFAGLCSGLTLGLLSIDKLSLNILLKAGTEKEIKYAKKLEPILKRHHLLLVTLLLWNALAMEALPLFLDRFVPEFLAILLSVTFVLVFGEVIPQAVIQKYGLAVGGNLSWVVRLLMVIAFPIAWPVSLVLDCMLGKDHVTYYKRAELKELVNIHAKHRDGKHKTKEGGEPILSKDELLVIRGALELKERSVENITTPLSRVFMLSYDRMMDMETCLEILKNGHSRIPIYRGNNRQDIVGLLLVKSLIAFNPEKPTPVNQLGLRDIPSVNSSMSLWDLLNMFQIGKSHMAIVKRKKTAEEIEQEQLRDLGKQPIIMPISPYTSNLTNITGNEFPISDEIVIGVVTLEDVIEELIQEEIVDETDVFVDMQKQNMTVVEMIRQMNNTIRRTSSSIFSSGDKIKL